MNEITRAANSEPVISRKTRLLFGVIVVLFFSQFMLKQYRYEPYPTLLLPGGEAQYVHDPRGLVYVVDELTAIGPDGVRTPFSFGEAFPELPSWYWDRVIADDFGLRRTEPHRGPISAGPLRIPIPTGVASPNEVETTRTALRSRIEPLVGHPVDSVRANRAQYRILRETGDVEVVRKWRVSSIDLVGESVDGH